MSKKSINSCIVGTGFWGREYAKASMTVSGLKVTSCFSRNQKKRDAFAVNFKYRSIDSWEALLRDTEIDALLVATPNSTHSVIVEEAALAGKHVFVEKPFVLNVKEGRKAIKICEQSRVHLAVGHQRRYQPAYRKLKWLLDADLLGQVVQVRALFPHRLAIKDEFDGWRAIPTENPMGVVTDLGVHHVDTLQYLFGPVKSVLTVTPKLSSSIGCDDDFAALVEFISGIHGFLGSNISEINDFSLYIEGNKANALIEKEGTLLKIQKKEQELLELYHFPVKGDPVTAPIAEELTDFVSAINDNRSPEVDGLTGLRASAVLEGIFVSSCENRRVELTELFL